MHRQLCACNRAKVEQELKLQAKHAELLKWEAQLKLNAECSDSSRLENNKLMAEWNEKQRLLQMQLQEKKMEEIQVKFPGSYWHELPSLQFSECKQKLAQLKQQLSLSDAKCVELKSGQKNQQAVIKQLQSRLSKPHQDLMALQAELEQTRKAHHKELLVLEYDNKQLGRQLAAQTERAIHFQKMLDEQLVQLRSAQREVQDLHFMLENTQPHRTLNKSKRLAS